MCRAQAVGLARLRRARAGAQQRRHALAVLAAEVPMLGGDEQRRAPVASPTVEDGHRRLTQRARLEQELQDRRRALSGRRVHPRPATRRAAGRQQVVGRQPERDVRQLRERMRIVRSERR